MSGALQYVTLVVQGGTPIRIADQMGAPYPTTGRGALVFAESPTLNNPTFTGRVISTSGDTLGLSVGSAGGPSLYFGDVANKDGLFSNALHHVNVTTNGVQRADFSSTGLSVTGGITATGALSGTTATFSGEIKAKTPLTADDDTTVATTEFVKNQGYQTVTAAGAAYAPISHTHPASQVTDFAEAVDDRVNTLIVAGTNITKTYNDAANTLTIAAVAYPVIPSSLPPSGNAGGDLTNTYPNPTIKLSVALGGTPTAATAAAGTNTGQLATTAFVKEAIDDAVVLINEVPIGTVVDFAGAVAPTGWLFCQGQAVSRTTYAALWTALGQAASVWGQGNGTSTFNVPNLNGRVTAGREPTASRLTVAGSGIDGATLGAAGGTQTHLLTLAQAPAHTHYGADGGSLLTANSSPFWENAQGDPGAGNWISMTGATDSKGGDTAHQNTQPTIIINKIIRT